MQYIRGENAFKFSSMHKDLKNNQFLIENINIYM